MFGEEAQAAQGTAEGDAADVFWRLMPGLCAQQSALTALPLAPHPARVFAQLAQSQQVLGLGLGLEKTVRHLRHAQHMCEKHHVQALPCFAPCTHGHFVNYGGTD